MSTKVESAAGAHPLPVIDQAGNRVAWVELQPLTGAPTNLTAPQLAIASDLGRRQTMAARTPS